MLLCLRSIAKYRTRRDSLECNPDDDVAEFLQMFYRRGPERELLCRTIISLLRIH